MLLTACIVLYKNEIDVVNKAITSLLKFNNIFKVYLIDNSLVDELKILKNDERIIYIHNPSNPGFGASHNIAINEALKDGSSYHFIVNPDVYFYDDVITPMADYISNHPDIGMLMPEILNPDGSIQYLPKLLPNPLTIILRKIKSTSGFYQKFIDKYELRFVNRDVIYTTPILSGCFTLLNLKAIKEVGKYDDSYFMYFEDWDLSRRMAEKYKTIYFPKVHIYHGYNSGANKSLHLFKIYLKSAFHYFNKWGWFFDNLRKQANSKTLAQFKI